MKTLSCKTRLKVEYKLVRKVMMMKKGKGGSDKHHKPNIVYSATILLVGNHETSQIPFRWRSETSESVVCRYCRFF